MSLIQIFEKLRACLVGVFKNYFLFLRTKNTETTFDRIFSILKCSPRFLRPNFREKNGVFHVFAIILKKIKMMLFLFSISVLAWFRLFFILWGKIFCIVRKNQKIGLTKIQPKIQHYLIFFIFLVILFQYFRILSPYDFLDAFQSQSLHKF